MEKLMHVCTFPGCEAKFHRPSKLEVHLRKHTGERPFVCDEENCNKTYTNNSHLRRHILQSHQKDKVKTYKCPVEECGKEFQNYDNMKRHKNTVHKKDYVCAICEEGFTKKHKLRSHVMVKHTGEINIKCELCDATFKNNPDYRRHVSQHKIYTCSCGKILHRWTAYLQHRRTEHKQNYTCTVCNKKFVTKANRDKHLQTHEDDRTVLECPVENCRRLYFYKRNLRHHVEVCHMDIKKPLPPSLANRYKKTGDRKPPKTLSTGRKPRKDKNTMKESTALKLVGLTVPREGEKSIVAGEKIEIENSDQLTSDYSDLDVSVKIFRRSDNTSDSDSATPKMLPVH